MDFDECFNREWFTDPYKHREGMFLDRKSEIYPIFDDKEKLADFIIDFIALANMSYRYGKVARILFGIDDNHNIVGVKKQSTKKKHLQDIDYENERDLEKLFRERIEQDIRRAIEQFISPKDYVVQLHWGKANDDGPIVAYLEIGADLNNPSAYRVKKELRSHRRIMRGQSWKREGEHNKLLSDDEYHNWLSYTECPIITGSKWRQYFDNLQANDFNRAVNIPGYIEPKSTVVSLSSVADTR